MKKNSKPIRVDLELEEVLKKMADDDDLSIRQASRKLAREFKQKKQNIKF